MLMVGEQTYLDVTISPDNATNKKILWHSSNESVATVSSDGLVEAISAGFAIISATSESSGGIPKVIVRIHRMVNISIGKILKAISPISGAMVRPTL